jgi:hypothetical protein
MQNTIEQQLQALETKPGFEIRFIRNPVKFKSDDWKESAFQWLVIFPNGLTVDYWTGKGHCTFYGMSYDRKYWQQLNSAVDLGSEAMKIWIKQLKPTKPKLKDIIYALQSDAYAASMSFRDWCSDFGYSDDSINALNTYNECCKSADKLRTIGFNDIRALNEFYQDY